MLRKLLMTIFTLVTLLISGTSSFAQEKLRLAWAGASPTNSPIWVIQERKLLQKQGVHPEIIAIGNSPTVLQALVVKEQAESLKQYR